MKPRRRTHWITRLAVLLIIIAAFSLLTYIFAGSATRRNARSIKLISELKQSNGNEPPEVSHLGTVIRRQDGSWIAINYGDTHSVPTYSVAYARCSDGSWYRSTEHFCGKFSSFQKSLDIAESFRKLLNDSSTPEVDKAELEDSFNGYMQQAKDVSPELAGILEAPTLEAAKRLLEEMKFTEISPP